MKLTKTQVILYPNSVEFIAKFLFSLDHKINKWLAVYGRVQSVDLWVYWTLDQY